ncbi:MAG: hypothetical protein JSW41_03835 [Candidatus Aenigmatarchaeota archaeon]|nr:MAG: hypothetical protein JSW41_03835 [Candidatus Aenigmarchaeota archaeon]
MAGVEPVGPADPREVLLLQLKQQQAQEIPVRPGVGGNFLRAIIGIVKRFGPLRVWFGMVMGIVLFPDGIIKAKEGKISLKLPLYPG